MKLTRDRPSLSNIDKTQKDVIISRVAEKKLILVWIIFLSFTGTWAQIKTEIYIKNSYLTATNGRPPFWFTANQNGKIKTSGHFLNITDFIINQSSKSETSTEFSWIWGGNLVAALGERKYYQLNKAFFGISLKDLELKGGMFQNITHFAGLSTTNGNMLRSENARPYPMVRFSIKNYKPVPFLGNWLKYKGEYDEGILNDNRYVEKTRLHHKCLYLLVKPNHAWDIHMGLEHFVMWGGISKDKQYGKLPANFKSYVLYIFGASGNSDFVEIDQLNAAGNHLGAYQFQVVKHFIDLKISFYLSHPFENWTGRNWRNWKDNLLGIHLSFENKKKFITDVLFEYTHTRHQGIRDSVYKWNETNRKWERQLLENYFTHIMYRSGFTYHQQVIGSPLFSPVIQEEHLSSEDWNAIRSTRLSSLHLGFSGHLMKYIKWKGLLTWIHHFGTYYKPFLPSRKQLSGFFEVQYTDPKFPVELGLSIGVDDGNTIQRNMGFQFWIAKKMVIPDKIINKKGNQTLN